MSITFTNGAPSKAPKQEPTTAPKKTFKPSDKQEEKPTTKKEVDNLKKQKDLMQKQINTMKKVKETMQKRMSKAVLGAKQICLLRLDMVADRLEKENPRLAFEIDRVTSAIEKSDWE